MTGGKKPGSWWSGTSGWGGGTRELEGKVSGIRVWITTGQFAFSGWQQSFKSPFSKVFYQVSIFFSYIMARIN